jgi:hypothetical protein
MRCWPTKAAAKLLHVGWPVLVASRQSKTSSGPGETCPRQQAGGHCS